MLLWHDSLDYRNSGVMASRYVTASGFTLTGTHPRSGKKSLQATGTTGTLIKSVVQPNPSAFGAETCIFGFMYWSSVYPLTSYVLAEVQTVSGTVQVRIRAVTSGTKTILRVLRGSDASILHESSPIDFTSAKYVEIAVTISSGGSVAIYIDGTLDSKASLINTQSSLASYWGRVSLTPSSSGVGSYARIADFYIADGVVESGKKTFAAPLGPVLGSRLAVNRLFEDAGWAPGVAFGGKYKLIILAGGNNNHGRGKYSGGQVAPWRTTNTKVQIWRRSGVSYGYDVLRAGVNTYGFFLTGTSPDFWGPEMMLAEKIAQFFESSSDDTAPNVRIIKLCQDASILDEFDKSPEFSWLPAQTNSLYQRSQTQITAAVNALGGWSQIQDIDFFWHQGEAEALTDESIPNLVTLTDALFAAFQASFPVTCRFYRTLPSKRIVSPVYSYIGSVRSMLSSSYIRGTVIDLEDPPLQDAIHLSNEGYNRLGEKYFELWKQGLLFGEDWSDYFTLLSVDSKYIAGSSGASTSATTKTAYELELVNSRVFSVNWKMHADAAFTEDIQVEAELGPAVMPALTVSASGVFSGYSSIKSQIVLPESVVSNSVVVRVL